MKLIRSALAASLLAMLPATVDAAAALPDQATGWTGLAALAAFLLACALMLVSAALELRRSKAMMLAAGVICSSSHSRTQRTATRTAPARRCVRPSWR
jgi:hypothetical protein